MKTYTAKLSDIEKQWYIIDAKDIVLGRMASEVAKILRGKHKTTFTPHMDCGDNVIIINADKVHLTGKKLSDKIYYRHTGYPGGIKESTPERIFEGKNPEKVVKLAVKRMISRNKLGSKQMSHLYVYAGEEHPHTAQTPQVIDIASKNIKNNKVRSDKK